MADTNSYYGQNGTSTGINSNSNVSAVANETNSRLVSSTDALRNALLARNLYTPEQQYPLDPSEIGKIINSIDSIIDVIAPFKGFALEDTVIGRAIDDKTPLVRIGLKMLGKQFAYNMMSNVAHETYKVMKPSNLFDGNKSTKLFVSNKDFNITNKVASNNFTQFLQNISAKFLNKEDYPFNSESTDADYLNNTGSGQLDVLFTSLNRNLYVSTDPELVNMANKIGNDIKPRSFIIDPLKVKYFDFSNRKFNPYSSIKTVTSKENKANSNMRIAYADSTEQQYAPTQEYIDSNFGSSESKNSSKKFTGENDWIGDDNGFSGDNIENQIVWGRDLNDEPNAYLPTLQGIDYLENKASLLTQQNLSSNFGAKIGLLKYTQELLNSTEGRIVDITRKAFTNGDELIGFNGSGLWKAPSNALLRFANKTGLRQHTVLDQYDRYAKAIRFDGNSIYKENVGNIDSVISKTVMPKIHPIQKKNITDDKWNKNMMFSIENLAIRAISKDDNVGIIDDNMGSTIPAAEVGPFNGRIMWFPPYNIELNETTTAKYESTVMVGRSEPIYAYQNSERSCTLNFTLLIDYPPQLRDNFYSGKNKHKAISEFFAFGANKAFGGGDNVENIQTAIEDTKIEIDTIKLKPFPVVSNLPTFNSITAYFPNDYPFNLDQGRSVFNDMYDMGYEVSPDCFPPDGSTNGKNAAIYHPYELLDSEDIKYPFTVNSGAYDQYLFNKDSNSSCPLDNLILNINGHEDDIIIKIVGSASKLYEVSDKREEYNFKLGERRTIAMQTLITARYEDRFGKPLTAKFELVSMGDKTAKAITADVNNISSSESKDSRSVLISVIPNTSTNNTPKATLSPEDNNRLNELQAKLTDLNTRLSKAKSADNNINNVLLNERPTDNNNSKADDNSTKQLNGFQGIAGNYYVPAFHSQTPEEFHRRLVFLQQCMRQGSAQLKGDGLTAIKNSVFGRQPICIIRVGDFMYTKVIIENLTIDYTETTWDMNPEGFGMQPMLAKVTLQMKVIGGQSLKGPIDALQNAVSFNYYANSTFTNKGIYAKPYNEAVKQESYMTGILQTEIKELQTKENVRLVKEGKPIFFKQ